MAEEVDLNPTQCRFDPDHGHMYYNHVMEVPEGYHWEAGSCPNIGHACFCIGKCRPTLVKDEPEEPEIQEFYD